MIVFHHEITVRTLFHGLVHAAQMAFLGLNRYTELYVRGFVKARSWIAIPLEEQAYQLDTRVAMSPSESFSVESEVRAGTDTGSSRRQGSGRPVLNWEFGLRKAPSACGEAPGAGGG